MLFFFFVLFFYSRHFSFIFFLCSSIHLSYSDASVRFVSKTFLFSLLFLSIHPSGRRLPSGACPLSDPTLGTAPLVPVQVARHHLHPSPPLPHNSPSPIPTPINPPTPSPTDIHPPTCPTVPSIICPANLPLTSPSHCLLSPPRTPHPCSSSRDSLSAPSHRSPSRTEAPPAPLTLQLASPSFTLCILFSCITHPTLSLQAFPHPSFLHLNSSSLLPSNVCLISA